MSATKVPEKLSVFATLFNYVAGGLFFLRHALSEHTSPENQDAIMGVATDLYERSIANGEVPYVPHFRFVPTSSGHVEVTLFRKGSLGNAKLEIGRLLLVSQTDPQQPHTRILVLEKHQQSLAFS